MLKEEQHKKEHYQTEGIKSTSSDTCDVCHGSGSIGDDVTCYSCNGSGEI